VIPFNVAPVATANSTNTQRDVDTADGGGDDLEDAERALGTNDRGADDASHLHMLTHHAKKVRRKLAAAPQRPRRLLLNGH
jgi:hypothetical protein